jgi:radical SAM protein with 4Fe4S-binding SPASM domain
MPLPEFMQIEVTTKCNFNCITCSRQSLSRTRINRDLSFFEFKKIIDENPNLKTVKLQGLGEPFLNRDIKQMAEYAKQKGIRVITITNGSLLPEADVLQLFDEITISFDAANKETFESIRRGANFDKIVENIKEMVKLKEDKKLKLRISLNAVISHLNYMQMEDIVKLASSLKVDSVGFVEVENWYIPSQKEFATAHEFVMKARHIHKEVEAKVKELRRRYKNLVIYYVSSEKRKRTCPWAFYSAFVTVDGYLTPCCIRMDKDAFYFDNILAKPFAEVWNSDPVKQFREKNIKNLPNPVCDLCPD